MLQTQQIIKNISSLKTYWSQRNRKFQEWYAILTLVDQLAAKGMESYVSNEPGTFYQMAHYLTTKGELSHTAPIESESALELDIRAKINRGCNYMWSVIDRERQLGGSMPFVDELCFYLLILGWYSTVLAFDKTTGLMKAQIWNPADAYPDYANNRMVSCVHSYKVSEEEAAIKAEENMWNYQPKSVSSGEVILDDYFYQDKDGLHNVVFINGQDVTGWVDRPEIRVLIAPVSGFPDKGSLTSNRSDWRQTAGRSIFAVNEAVSTSLNKWYSMISQILRDTAQPITQEFSGTPHATPEQLRERGGLFHYAPGEKGLERLPPAIIPIEIQAHMLETRRELQKGSFNDAVYGMMEGQAGYALSLLSSSSANQILYPYMDAKHFVISESDRFWLSSLKTSKRVFDIKGKLIEKLKPTDIPEDVSIVVESDVATPKDWMERGTIGNMLDKHLDEATIITEIYHLPDPQAIKRRKSLDRILGHPMSQMVEMIAGYYAHADYLEARGDTRQAALFRRAAQALEGQLGAPSPGQAPAPEMGRVMAEREAGAPAERTRVSPIVAPPEAISGFTPAELRRMIGRGSIRAK